MRETDASGFASPTYSVHALCTDRREKETALLAKPGPMQQQTTYSMHALCIDRCKQDVASLGTTWPHGATHHLQHACLVQIQGKRRGEGCGGHGVWL